MNDNPSSAPGVAMTFTEAELDYLRGQRLGRLATPHPDGTLQVSPVGFGVNTELGTIDIGGRDLAASRRYRKVAANGQAAFVVDDITSTQPWVVRCLEIRRTRRGDREPGRFERECRRPDHPAASPADHQLRRGSRESGRGQAECGLSAHRSG
jgi:pyridoxamine 5'-phosphate oxidase family protein